MKKSQNLDTSVEVTFKDGSKKIFSSLKEAADNTGLSEAALKIRANKSRAGSANKKDKIHVRWISDTTFRSYQSKKSRNKGFAFEAEIVNKLKEIGYDVCRSAGESRRLDSNKVDIAGDIPFAIQAKHVQNLPNYYTIRESCTDKRPLALLWKKAADIEGQSKGELAIIPIEYFYRLLELIK